MAAKNRAFSAIKVLFRGLIFYGIWLGPLFAFYFWHYQNSKALLKALEFSPWQFIYLAMGWWLLSWISMYALQTLWPVLLLIFYGTERERSPKKIITIGDRFRKMNLSTPQIFALKEKSRFWSNRIWGFYSLPSPIGALLLLDEEILQKMPAEQLDMWICRQVVESRFSRFSSVRFQFFALVPTITFLGAFFGSSLSKFNLLTTELTTGGFFLAAVFVWRSLQIERMQELDRRTLSSFHLPAKEYFESLAQAEAISPTFDFSKNFLNLSLENRAKSIDNTTWFRAWLTWAVPPAIILAFVIGFFIQTPLKDISYVVKAGFGHPGTEIPNIAPIIAVPKKAATATVEPKIPPNENIVSTVPVPDVAAEVATPSPLNDISKAIFNGDWRAVIRQLGNGKSIHLGDPAVSGATPLMLAAKKGDFDMVYLLLILGANPQTELDSLGHSVLFYALECEQRQKMVNYILRTRVDINKKSNDGLTAIDYAKKNGWLDVVTALEQRSLASEPASAPTQISPSNK